MLLTLEMKFTCQSAINIKISIMLKYGIYIVLSFMQHMLSENPLTLYHNINKSKVTLAWAKVSFQYIWRLFNLAWYTLCFTIYSVLNFYEITHHTQYFNWKYAVHYMNLNINLGTTIHNNSALSRSRHIVK